MSTGLLQEYGVWQLLTAVCFFLTGLLFELKSSQYPLLGRATAALGSLLCVDELFMLHECLDQVRPHVFLSCEFILSALAGVWFMRAGLIPRAALLLPGLLSTTALALEITGKGREYAWTEESLEVTCAFVGFLIAAQVKGRVNLKYAVRRALFWSALCLAAGVLVLAWRPQVCPTVDYWSKKYFHEQIW